MKPYFQFFHGKFQLEVFAGREQFLISLKQIFTKRRVCFLGIYSLKKITKKSKRKFSLRNFFATALQTCEHFVCFLFWLLWFRDQWRHIERNPCSNEIPTDFNWCLVEKRFLVPKVCFFAVVFFCWKYFFLRTY